MDCQGHRLSQSAPHKNILPTSHWPLRSYVIVMENLQLYCAFLVMISVHCSTRRYMESIGLYSSLSEGSRCFLHMRIIRVTSGQQRGVVNVFSQDLFPQSLWSSACHWNGAVIYTHPFFVWPVINRRTFVKLSCADVHGAAHTCPWVVSTFF